MPIRNIEALTEKLYIGSGANRVSIDTDGSLMLEGDATVWEDVTFPMTAERLDSTAGTLNYNYDEATITMGGGGDISASSDTLMFVCQIPHKIKLDSVADLHIHWEQPADQAYTFDVEYRIQSNGSAKTTAWTAISNIGMTNNVFPYTSGTLIQITDLVDIDLTGIGISDLIQVKLTRSDATAGNIEAIAVDFHFEIDSLGSRQEYVK